jgi:DNA-binding transcriptional ArsR family regulator
MQRYTGVVLLAEPRLSYRISRLDGGGLVTLSRREGNRTNYRLRFGDKVEFNIYRNSRGIISAFDPVLFDIGRHREPIHKPPPYHALGPVIRVGVRMPVNAT